MNLRPIVSFLSALPFVASANLVTNGSFEAGVFSPGIDSAQSLPTGSSAITGWSVVNDSVSWIANGNPWALTAVQGLRFLDLTDTQIGAPLGGVSQTIATDVGAPYRLTFSVGTSGSFGVPAAIRATAGPASQVFSVGSAASNLWTQMTLDFVATSTVSMIRFEGTDGQMYTGLDDVVVLSQVPELPAQGLMLVGLLGFGIAATTRGKPPLHPRSDTASEGSAG